MKIWITKRRAFRTDHSALDYLKNLRTRLAKYRQEKGGEPPSEIKITEDLMVFIVGCSSYAVRRVDLE